MKKQRKKYKVNDPVKYVGPIRCEWHGYVTNIIEDKIYVRWDCRPCDIGWEFSFDELEIDK